MEGCIIKVVTSQLTILYTVFTFFSFSLFFFSFLFLFELVFFLPKANNAFDICSPDIVSFLKEGD